MSLPTGQPRHPGRAVRLVVTAAAAAILLAANPGEVAGIRDADPAPREQQPPAPARRMPSFRAGVDIVSLTVTVTDQEGRYLTDLRQEEFAVFEEGVRQQVEFFNRTNLPLALSLLLDTSASMEDKLGTAQEAAVGFARRLRPEDLGELIDFDSRVQVAQGFTGDASRLEQAIRSTTAGGSTALYNAVYISLKELGKVRASSETDLRRQAIVVLSDGEDTSSLVTYDEVLDLAKRSETAVYAIGLQSRTGLASRGAREAEYMLRDLARQTGGRAFFPGRVEDLATVYGQIWEELASQYLLGYVSKNQRRDGAWRRTTVRVERPGAQTRAKLGYYGPR